MVPAFPARRPATPAAAPRPWIGETLKLWLIVAVCFLLGLIVIAQYSETVSLYYEISCCQDRLAELEEEYRQMELEAAGLAALNRIETVAREELGMREPDLSQVRVLTAHQGD